MGTRWRTRTGVPERRGRGNPPARSRRAASEHGSLRGSEASVAFVVEVHVRAVAGSGRVTNPSWIVVVAALIEMLVMDLLRRIAPMIPSDVVQLVSPVASSACGFASVCPAVVGAACDRMEGSVEG